MEGGTICIRCFQPRACFLMPYVNQNNAVVVSKGYHVIITTNIHVNRIVGRLLKGNITMYASGGGVGGDRGFDPWDFHLWPH